jgi:hypothetical protein
MAVHKYGLSICANSLLRDLADESPFRQKKYALGHTEPAPVLRRTSPKRGNAKSWATMRSMAAAPYSSRFFLFRAALFGLGLAVACGTPTESTSLGSGGSNSGGTGPEVGGANTGAAGPAGGGAGVGGATLGGNAAQPTGGQSGGNASAGGSVSGGAASSGGSSAAAGGNSTGGAGGGLGGSPSECTRALLDQALDDYLAALSAGDPNGLSLSPNLKFTENAEEAELGATSFWQNAGDAKHTQRALDTVECSVGAEAVIPEGGTDRPVAIRLKLKDSRITEIETIVVRPGDYQASFAVDSDPSAIIQASQEVGWHDPVPTGERATRQELIDWMNKYFRAFPSGVCNVASSCRRLENGGGNFSCGTGASCSASLPEESVFTPRIILADEERGIAVGLTIFDFQTSGHLDMHMMKMVGGEVQAVHAILRHTDGKSGWE